MTSQLRKCRDGNLKNRARTKDVTKMLWARSIGQHFTWPAGPFLLTRTCAWFSRNSLRLWEEHSIQILACHLESPDLMLQAWACLLTCRYRNLNRGQMMKWCWNLHVDYLPVWIVVKSIINFSMLTQPLRCASQNVVSQPIWKLFQVSVIPLASKRLRTSLRGWQQINGHFRKRFIGGTYTMPIWGLCNREYPWPKYGQRYGTNVAPF